MTQIYTRNTVSGQLGWVPEDYIDHPWFGQQLVRADESDKNAVPELHKSTDAAGHADKQATKAAAKGDALESSNAVD